MPAFSVFSHSGVNADSVIYHANGKIVSVDQAHLKSGSVRMCAGIFDGFVCNSVDFVAHDGMHFFYNSSNRKNTLHVSLATTIVDRASERVGKVVGFYR